MFSPSHLLGASMGGVPLVAPQGIHNVPLPYSLLGNTDQLSLSLQLYLLMSAQHQQQQLRDYASALPLKVTVDRKEEKKDAVVQAESPPSLLTPLTSSSSSAFSIEAILEERTVDAKDDDHLHTVKEEVAVYTLDALEGSDGRSKEREKRCEHRSVCDECGKSYATPSNLSRHKQTHRSMDSPHAKQCPHCSRVYVSMPALSMHLLTHNAQHVCEVCGKAFSRLWLLQGHLRSHSGARPFGCAHCGKFFADRSNLRAHILTHTGEKKFECSGCGKRFTLRSYLNRHMETACRMRGQSVKEEHSASS